MNSLLQNLPLIVLISALGVLAYLIRGPLLGLLSVKAAKKRAVLQRSTRETGPLRVRQTDIVQNMTTSDRQKHVQAEEFLKQGRVVEAAQLFESINFQRRAVDVLEKNGLLEEAVAMLLRLNAPNRAAVLFERNNELERAAEFYIMANLHEKAAAIYLALAKKDASFLDKAASTYETIGNVDGMLKVWSKTLQIPKIVAHCFKVNNTDALADVLRDPIVATQFFQKAEESQLLTFFSQLELTPQMTQAAMSWCWIYPKGNIIIKVLDWLRRDRALAKSFLKSAPGELLTHIQETLKKHGSHMSHDLVTDYSQLFQELEYANAALDLNITFGNIQNACKILIERHDITAIKDLITSTELVEATSRINAILKDNPNPPWPGSILKDINQLIDGLPTRIPVTKALNGKDTPKALELMLDVKQTA